MANIMIHLDILLKNVVGESAHGVNVLGVKSTPKEMKFEAL